MDAKRVDAFEVKRLRLSQGNRCAICGADEPLEVDVCETSGRLRGLLCAECLSLLDLSEGNLGILTAAIDYLIYA